MIGLSWLDWAVLASYLAGICLLGIWAGRQVKDSEGYLLAHRRFRWWIMVGQSFGVGTHAEMPVGLAGRVYGSGFSAIWFQWKNMFATPFYWLLAPILRRLRRATTGEVVEDRYGPWMGIAYTVFALSYFTLNQGVMLRGASRVISSMTGGALEEWHVIAGYSAIVLAYSTFGGLTSAAITDFAQSFLIIALSFLLIPFGLAQVGGLEGLHEKLPQEMFGLTRPGDIDLWLIFLLTLNGLIGIAAQPHILASAGTGRDERSCRVGFTYGNFLKRLCTLGWAMAGLLAVILTPGLEGDDRERAFGLLARELLGPGLVGLMIASVLASNMSTSSAFMVDSGALFARNVFRKIARSRSSDRAELRAARSGGVAFALLGTVVALEVKNVLEGFLFVETIASYMGIAIFGGIVWARANRFGAALSIAVALIVHFTADAWLGLDLRFDPRVFAPAFAGGCLALVLGSLLSRPEPAEKTKDFFERLKSPSDSTDDPSREGKDLLLVRLTEIFRPERRRGFFRRYRSDLTGFALGWLVVAGLILLAKVLMAIR